MTLPSNVISPGDRQKLEQITLFRLLNAYCDRYVEVHLKPTESTPAAPDAPDAPKPAKPEGAAPPPAPAPAARPPNRRAGPRSPTSTWRSSTP
jgi:hypothetical protein